MKYIKKYEYKNDDSLSWKFKIGDYVRVINTNIFFYHDMNYSDEQIFEIYDTTDNYDANDEFQYLIQPIGIEDEEVILANDADLSSLSDLELAAIKFNL